MLCSVEVPKSPILSSSSSLLRDTSYCAAEALTYRKRLHSPASASLSAPFSSFQISFDQPNFNVDSYHLIPSSVVSESSEFKRKRPAKLVIPVVPSSTFIPQTGTQKTVAEEGSGYWVYCKKGRREEMEDRFSASIATCGDVEQAIFGVYDGHGGAKAAEFAALNLHKNILNEVNSRLREETVEAVKQGYLKTDNEFLKEDILGGSCCVTALISEGNLIASNAGDCRAVMSSGGVAEALTNDHRPCVEDEKKRIEASGGYVDCVHGSWRIQGSLGVSRGIGDKHLKQWVTAEPQSRVVKLQLHHEFVILASDGLWDKVTNQEAVDVCRPLVTLIDEPVPLVACKNLVNLAISRGSADDISVMLISLQPFLRHRLTADGSFKS